jgi:hypothetical protein
LCCDGSLQYKSAHTSLITHDLGYDIFYPINTALLLSVILSLVVSSKSTFSAINLLPFVTFIVDMIENYCLYTVLIHYPLKDGMQLFVTIGSLACNIKWLTAAITISTSITGLLAYLTALLTG